VLRSGATSGNERPSAAELIHRDKIDVLFDLAGHTENNRLRMFARKPAPVQATYLGYPATTGLSAIDWRVTDALAEEPGLTEAHCSERLIRLPQSAWCYAPPEYAPAVNDVPALAKGVVTFGSFSNFPKVNEPTMRRWAQILQRVPQSRLFLKARAMGCASAQQRVRRIFAETGIDADRLLLRAHCRLRSIWPNMARSTLPWTPIPTMEPPPLAKRCGWACRSSHWLAESCLPRRPEPAEQRRTGGTDRVDAGAIHRHRRGSGQ